MQNLVIFFSRNQDILKIVSKYKETYKADLYEIEVKDEINFMTKFKSTFLGNNINIKRCNLNLKNYQNIILISPLWFGKIPKPVIRFLEFETGNINNIIYILTNKNKDKPKEFDKMDKILNLRRDKSYFVSLDKNDIHVRVYQ